MNLVIRSLLLFALPMVCLAQTEQEILDKGGPEALLVIEKAYEQLSETEVFEFSDVGWGTPSASCWGLTVLIRYAPKEEVADRFLHILDNSDNSALRFYAAVGLNLLYPKSPEVSTLLEDKKLLSSKLAYASGCTGGQLTGADLLWLINKEEGGIEKLLFKTPLPRLYKTKHSYDFSSGK